MFNQVEDVVSTPTFTHKFVIYSDGNDDYKSVLPEYYKTDVLCYGQKIKHKNGEKLFPAIHRRVFGNPNLKDIDTNSNESFNSILRGKLSRLVRKTKAHSKKKIYLESALFLFQFSWNFMHKNEKNLTPAILEKQATKVWTWVNFLHTKIKYLS